MVFINAEMKERTPGITPGVPLSLISIIEAIIICKHRPISDIFLIIRPNHVVVVEGHAAVAVCVLDEILHQRAVNCITDCLLADAMKAAQSGATVREIIYIPLVKRD